MVKVNFKLVVAEEVDIVVLEMVEVAVLELVDVVELVVRVMVDINLDRMECLTLDLVEVAVDLLNKLDQVVQMELLKSAQVTFIWLEMVMLLLVEM